MYCSACHLEYSDPLKYCKQCGRSLVRQAEEPAAPSRCCTRCGARVIPGENFCQQCGARLQVRSEDTTIGACAGCGTPWRSAWLYCRTCGTDREHALQFNSAPAPPEQAVPTVTMEAVSAETIAAESVYVPETNPGVSLDFIVREATGGTLRCGRCGAEALPYAQFCEICGASLSFADLRSVPSKPLNNESPHAAGEQIVDSEEWPGAAPGVDTNVGLTEEEEANQEALYRTFEVPAVTKSAQLRAAEETDEANGIEGEEEDDEDASRRPTSRIVAEALLGDSVSTANYESGGLESPALNAAAPASVAPTVPAAPATPATGDAFTSGAHRAVSNNSRSEIEVDAGIGRTIGEEQYEETPAEAQAGAQVKLRTTAEEDFNVNEPRWDTHRPSSSAPLNMHDSAARNRKAAWQTLAIAVCIVILTGLVALIIWQAMTGRRSETSPGPTPEPSMAASPTTAPSVAPSQGASSRPDPPEGMVYVSGGAIRLGRDDGDDYERPVREVTVAPFFMDRTEVSNEQYQRFVAETKRAAPQHWSDGQYPAGEASLPVVNVTWEDAAAYANWAGKRLPTEEEWEYAARGGDGRLYPWGDSWNASRANTREAGRGRIVAVGSYPEGASQFGLLDLIGNVWEWTSSDLRSYGSDGQILAPGKVIRGGAWDVPRERATATYRGVVQPDRPYEKTGFRCIKPAP